jgi:type I restriction enzyme M protein
MQAALKGVEKKPLPHMLCVTNMLLHGIEAPTFVRHDNTLARPYVSYGPDDRVDVVLTNPPFGGMEEPGIESNFPTQFQTRETADLFLALIMRLLKPGGRAAVVLPDGFLYGEGVKTRLKEQLLEECNLHTIVRLPNSVFKPYAGIGTNLFFFEKGSPTRDIWFYEHRVPAGQKAYSMTKPIRLAHLEPCAEWWGGAEREGRVDSDVAWRVLADEVVARGYNLDITNPHVTGNEHRNPLELIQELNASEEEAARVRTRLKQELETAHLDGAELLLTELGRLADGADAFDQLRRFVLALALRGDLTTTEQKPIDLQARQREIARGMAELLESRPRYRWKDLSAEAGDDGAVPLGWYRGAINETGLYVNGRAFKAGEFVDRGLPVIRIQNLSGFNAEFNLASGEFPDDNMVRPGDLLVSWSATLETYVWAGPEGVLNQHIFKVVPNLAAVIPEYLYWLLKHEVRALADSQHAHGLGMMHINRGPFLAHPALIPPKAEQQVIVARLKQAMALCDGLESSVASVTAGRLSLLEAILHQALGDAAQASS